MFDMKPNFALSLSHEKIRLLHRVVAGWQLVGEVDTEAPDIADQLALLRSTATALDPGGLRCKLVIPDELIKYLSIETGPLDLDARREAASKALEGATPYAVSELTFDIFADGAVTHIAAVASETLEEAEAFALEHRMHPVSFVAAPATGGFSAEPFFGPTQAASTLLEDGIAPVPDEMPITASPPVAGTTDSATDLPTETPDDLPDQEDFTDLESSIVEPASETAHDSVGFVSRRTVPTFRTSANELEPRLDIAGATDGAVPGFSDDPEEFSPAVVTKPVEERPALHNVARRTTGTSEAERMAVFGARDETRDADAKRRIALVVAVIVLVPVGIAAFASGAVTSTFSALFDRTSSIPPTAQFAAPLQPGDPAQTETSPPTEIELASLTPELSDEDAAVLEALRAPPLAEVAPTDPPTDIEVQSSYAVTGIWPVAPEVPSPPPLIDLDNLYITSIDPNNPDLDAVALPAVKSYRADAVLNAPASPAPAGTRFELDARGMVVATEQGALNPDGIRVVAGPPPVRQPDNLLRVETPGEDLSLRMALAAFRPKQRPADLIENSERASLSGRTRAELAQLRPRLRPQSAQESAAASAASLVQLDGDGSDNALIQPNDENSFDGATSRAVAASLRPGTRPSNFSDIVAKALKPQQVAPTPVATASVAPRTVAPRIPSSASASREATVKNAINLRKVNLIGVYGTPSSRRALVRLGNGRFRKVEVGDKIDGGRVSAIGDSELRYQKKGRAYVLKMPQG